MFKVIKKIFNTVKKIIIFFFKESKYDCVTCIYGTSTGHGYPCCECKGGELFEPDYEYLKETYK